MRDPTDTLVAATHAYCVLQNLVYNELVMPISGAEGLDRFTRLFAEHPMRDELDQESAERLVSAHRAGCTYWLEARMTPGQGASERVYALRDSFARRMTRAVDWLRSDADVAQSERSLGEQRPLHEYSLPAVGLILHFVKRLAPVPDAEIAPTLLGARDHQARTEAWNQVERIIEEMALDPLIARLIVGFDVCGSEAATEMGTFAVPLRYLRNRGRPVPPLLSAAITAPEAWYRTRRTFLTCHAGEDFAHLLGGLRHVDEALEFYDMREGDRIGHGTALGVDPEGWQRRGRGQCYLRRGDWLDDLVWFHQWLAWCGGSPTVRYQVAQQIELHSAEVYGKPVGPSLLWKAWRLRREDPGEPFPGESRPRHAATTAVQSASRDLAARLCTDGAVLAVPIVLNADTPRLGDSRWCGDPGERYDCMVDLSYVPGSMRINRVYHPNRARNSYAFVDTVPLTDAPDDDEAYFNADQNFLYLTVRELRPRADDPEDAGLVWSYELATDGGIAHTPCESYPLVQNWDTIFADNAEPYFNDIIGHIFCASPRLRAEVSTESDVVVPGDLVDVSVTLSYDSVEPPLGKDISRFAVLRPRVYLNYPEDLLEVTAIDKSDQAEDLQGYDESSDGGGVVYWERRDEEGDGQILPGQSDELRVSVRVRDDAPSGAELLLKAVVRSQRTLDYQNVDAALTLTATDGSEPSCGDGICSGEETKSKCARDCPACVGEDGVTSFDDPPCCDGLVRIRASHPYEWAYGQCYDWQGGGVPFAQAYCTRCGDGDCRGLENPCNCPTDCGPHCGNWVCETGEYRASCPADC